MQSEPVVRVVRGAPTDEEVAALIGVLSLRRAEPPARVAVSQWARSGRPMGRGPRPGPGAWRASGLPSRHA